MESDATHGLQSRRASGKGKGQGLVVKPEVLFQTSSSGYEGRSLTVGRTHSHLPSPFFDCGFPWKLSSQCTKYSGLPWGQKQQRKPWAWPALCPPLILLCLSRDEIRDDCFFTLTLYTGSTFYLLTRRDLWCSSPLSFLECQLKVMSFSFAHHVVPGPATCVLPKSFSETQSGHPWTLEIRICSSASGLALCSRLSEAMLDTQCGSVLWRKQSSQ